jgi:hypothetical protein
MLMQLGSRCYDDMVPTVRAAYPNRRVVRYERCRLDAGSLLAYGLSFIVSPVLYVYQILFLTVGLATVITAPCTCSPLASSLRADNCCLPQ